MAIRKVALLGNPVLRKVAQPVPPDRIGSPEIQSLIRDLADTMFEYEGVGLAAPQVYESLRIFVLYPGAEEEAAASGRPIVWINPTIKVLDAQTVDGWEGCLSIPEIRGIVPRPPRIEITGQNATGQPRTQIYEGFPAVVAQHEFDHLEGIIFFDRMKDFSTLTYLKEFERYWQPREEVDDE